MTWLYCSAILLGSCLLFLVQPMCAKMLLPLLGGTPAAWSTCMVFFQAGLLAGYAYAHGPPRWLGVSWHGLLHLVLLIAAFFLLPIRLPDEVPAGWHPILWLLASLTLSVGLPFVLLAAGAPLVQRWYVARHLASPRDPYFLYAASNVGSFVGLALFPFVMEPFWPLSEQSDIWRFGFLALTALLAFCVPLRVRTAPSAPASNDDETPTLWLRGRWIMLALIPSSLLLSVTTHLTTDVAAIPLLWLIPMALYLLTFTLVFARRQWLPHDVVLRWLPLAALVLAIVILSEANDPLPLVMGLHLLCFFWLALACHGELSHTRPAPAHLTDFYLCLAVGGVMGGVISALLAPLVFSGLYEYPLMMVLACVFAPERGARPTRDDWLYAAAFGGVTLLFVFMFQTSWLFALPPGPYSVAAMFALPVIVCYGLKAREPRFALGMGAILLASGTYHGMYGAAAYRDRSWFGIHRVTKKDGFMQLIHGNTIHGQQSLDPERRHLPLAYYAHEGPIGDLFRAYRNDRRLQRVGVVGLGTGSLAAYARAGDEWTFFEIDPSVKRIAQDAKLFTYLRDAQGSVTIDIGDARLQLQKSKQSFGLLVVDAFGSDAIPVHLLTREAMRVYFDRLAPGGLLAFHISNRYVDLEPVLANLAADAMPSRVAYVKRHRPKDREKAGGVRESDWLVISASDADLRPLRSRSGWSAARPDPDLGVWTDDRSNLFRVFRWRGDE